jgi:DNA polymerase (family 10)
LKELEEIQGIGEGLGGKIVEYLETGKIREYEKMKKSLPAGIGALLRIPGLGPYRAENLYHHHIGSVFELKKAVREHRVAAISGFGPQSEEQIAVNLGLAKPHEGRRPRAEVLPLANKILSAIKQVRAVERAEVVGSLRRKEATIGDIDLLAISDEPAEVMEAFLYLPDIQKIILRGPKKSEVLLKEGLQVDFRVFQRSSYGAAMIYFTGNKQHNIQLRKRAIGLRYKLNEYGLFDKKGNLLAGKTEEDVYRKLGLKWIPPEERKNEGELEAYQI